MNHFNDNAAKYLPEYLLERISTGADVTAQDAEYLTLLEEDPDEPMPFILPRTVAENMHLSFPSMIGSEILRATGYGALAEKELLLRKGQANDTLQAVRTTLGEKSFLFRHDLRLADSKVKKTKSWTRLITVNKKLNAQRWIYKKCRLAMIELAGGETEIPEYRELTREDVRVSTAVMKPNQAGQRDASLAWFWTLPYPTVEVHGENGDGANNGAENNTAGPGQELLKEGNLLSYSK